MNHVHSHEEPLQRGQKKPAAKGAEENAPAHPEKKKEKKNKKAKQKKDKGDDEKKREKKQKKQVKKALKEFSDSISSDADYGNMFEAGGPQGPCFM